MAKKKSLGTKNIFKLCKSWWTKTKFILHPLPVNIQCWLWLTGKKISCLLWKSKQRWDAALRCQHSYCSQKAMFTFPVKHLQNSSLVNYRSSVPQRVICDAVGQRESVILASLRCHDGKHFAVWKDSADCCIYSSVNQAVPWYICVQVQLVVLVHFVFRINGIQI